MKPIDVSKLTSWMDDRVESYLDDDLSIEEQAAFANRMMEEPDWEEEVMLAHRIQDSIQSMPSLSCPTEVTQNVFAFAENEIQNGFWYRLRMAVEEFRWFTWQPYLALGLVLAFVGTGLFLNRSNVGASSSPDPEVANALEDVKWTLAYLSEVSKQTGEAVRDDVLKAHVAPSMEYAFKPERRLRGEK